MALTWLLEGLAVAIGGGLNAAMMIALTPAGGGFGLVQLIQYLSAGITSYLFASVLYGLSSPSHAVFATHKLSWKDESAVPISIGMVVAGGVVNAAIFGLLASTTGTVTFWNWIAGVVAFFGLQLISWLATLIN